MADIDAGQGSEGQGANPVGRPSEYTTEIGDKICAKLAGGKSLKRICEQKDMPSRQTVYTWLRTNQEFLDNYTRAKDDSADALADDIEDIARKVLTKEYDPNAARVAVDAKKWVASKLKPKKYGDKLDLTTGNEKLNRGMSDAELNAILARAAGTAPDQAGAGAQT
jgi:hypothetical protein